VGTHQMSASVDQLQLDLADSRSRAGVARDPACAVSDALALMLGDFALKRCFSENIATPED
jgi:hypothetical protein